MRLFENPGHGNDWITLKLVGVKTNRAAIGARIKVTVETADGATRAIYRTVGSGGRSAPRRWRSTSASARPRGSPTSRSSGRRRDTRQHLAHPDKNQWLEITEGSPSAVRLNRPRLSLEPGGKPGVRDR